MGARSFFLLLVRVSAVFGLALPKDMRGIEPIRIAAQATGVYIGCGFDDEMLFNTGDQRYFDFHFANFMLSNAPEACTWGTIEAIRGQYNYHRCSQAFIYALDARQLYRAGPIISHAHLPPWFSALDETTKTETALRHVTKVVSHLHELEVHSGLDVYAWDVLSDVMSSNGTELWPQLFLTSVLSAARAADPHAHMLMRESGVALPGAKAEAFFQLCRTLFKAGVPLSGVNMRLHIGVRAVATKTKTGKPDVWFALSWYDHVGEDSGGHMFQEFPHDLAPEMHVNAGADPEDIAASLETSQHPGQPGVGISQYDQIVDLESAENNPIKSPGKNPSRRRAFSGRESVASSNDESGFVGRRPWAEGIPESIWRGPEGERIQLERESRGVRSESGAVRLGVSSFDWFFRSLYQTIYRYHNEGLFVFLSDVQIDIEDTGIAPLADLLDVQAFAYVALINVCVTIPRCRTLELRALTDKYGNGKKPYIFDENYKPKRAHAEMVYMVATLTAIFIVFVLLMAVGFLHIYVRRRMAQLEEETNRSPQAFELHDLAQLAAAIAHIRGAALERGYEHVAENEVEAEDEEQDAMPSDVEAHEGNVGDIVAAGISGGYAPVETDEDEDGSTDGIT